MPRIRKIKQFDKQEVRRIRVAIEDALEKVGNQYGVQIKGGSGSFSSNNLTLKLEASIVGENGEVKSKESETFKLYAKMYGLDPTDLGKTFTTFSNKTFEITGLMTRSRKYPIIVKDVITGKGFKFAVLEVKSLLERSKNV